MVVPIGVNLVLEDRSDVHESFQVPGGFREATCYSELGGRRRAHRFPDTEAFPGVRAPLGRHGDGAAFSMEHARSPDGLDVGTGLGHVVTQDHATALERYFQLACGKHPDARDLAGSLSELFSLHTFTSRRALASGCFETHPLPRAVSPAVPDALMSHDTARCGTC